MTAATLSEALAKVYAIEAKLAVTTPVAYPAGSVVSWPYFPPQSQVVTDTPAILHQVSPVTVRYEAGGWDRNDWAVHCRLLIYNADSDEAAKIAASYIEPVIETFAGYITLGGIEGWFIKAIRFNGDQPVKFLPESDSAGPLFVGLDYYVDLGSSKTITIAAGSLP